MEEPVREKSIEHESPAKTFFKRRLKKQTFYEDQESEGSAPKDKDESQDWEPSGEKEKRRKVKPPRALRSNKTDKPMVELSNGDESDRPMEPSGEDEADPAPKKAAKKQKTKKEPARRKE